MARKFTPRPKMAAEIAALIRQHRTLMRGRDHDVATWEQIVERGRANGANTSADEQQLAQYRAARDAGNAQSAATIADLESRFGSHDSLVARGAEIVGVL